MQIYIIVSLLEPSPFVESSPRSVMPRPLTLRFFLRLSTQREPFRELGLS